MIFNSYIFAFLFLPICVLGYFLLNNIQNRTYAYVFLLGMSLWFYGYFNLRYLAIIIVSILVNYMMHMILIRVNGKLRSFVLAVAIVFNLGLLFYFKYANFFIENLNLLFKTDFVFEKILLPLGISFFTFQQISFIIDTYKGEVKRYNFIKYSLFVTFFPQLIAGPIVTHDELVPQFEDEMKRKINWDNFGKGILIFVIGMSKKVLIADIFGNAVNWGYSNIGELDSISAFIIMISYTFQIYFDFSGYCDMAIGIGNMMNISLPINFNSPYKALTISEFWKRWHITLTRFFTKYVYIPLGGNRHGKIREYINTMIVFLLSGLWHGANWTFILWGAFHGAFLVINKMFKNRFEKLHPALNWWITFSFVNLTWVLFRADSIKDGLRIIYRLFKLEFTGIHKEIKKCFSFDSIDFLLKSCHLDISRYYNNFYLVGFFLLTFFILLGCNNFTKDLDTIYLSKKKGITIVLLFVLCVISFSGISTFLYFNF